MSTPKKRTHVRRTDNRVHKRLAPSAHPDQHAYKIAESVDTAWHRSHGSGRLDVPLSVVATLAALPQVDSNGHDVTVIAADWNADELLEYARHTWRSVIRARPDIGHLLHPIIAWIFDKTEPNHMRRHAHAVAQAALRQRQPDLTGTHRRTETDLLGTVLTVLRPQADRKARGQFYTPSAITDLLAHMSIVEEKSRVTDPMMGTGGMFRATATAMRSQGRDPRTVTWIGCDRDNIAVACAAVNSMIWNLGHDIVFHTGNAFADDWEHIALARRDEMRSLVVEIAHSKEMVAALHRLTS